MSKVFIISAPEGTGSSGSSNDSKMKNVEPMNDGFPSRFYPPDVSKGTQGKAGTTGKSRVIQTGEKAVAHQKPHSNSDNCNSSLYSPFDDDGSD